MNIKKLNEAISRALRESKDDIFIPMLMDYFNVPASDIRKATEDENWKSNMTYDDYYVKGNGFFEVVSRDELLGSCVDRLEDLKDAAEASVIAKIFQQFIDDYGEDILINKKIEEVTEDNLEYVIDNIKFNKLSELLLSDDINYVTDIGQWVNSYDGEIHFLGNVDGIDYYISRFDSGKNESVEPLNEDVNTVYVLIDKKISLKSDEDLEKALDVLDAESLINRAKSLNDKFEHESKEADLGSPLMSDVLYAIQMLRGLGYAVIIRNVK